ncbi:MAG: hypothetical protein ACYCUF_13360, partial [Acidimicrobiales bacterium]
MDYVACSDCLEAARGPDEEMSLDGHVHGFTFHRIVLQLPTATATATATATGTGTATATATATATVPWALRSR